MLWATYAEALFATGEYAEAKTVCERVLDAMKSNNVANASATIITMRLILSYILQELNIEPEAQKECVPLRQARCTRPADVALCSHTQWCVRFLKKNPRVLPDDMYEKYLILEDGKTHPVLAALGGDEWLQKMNMRKKNTFKQEERQTRRCRQCGTPEIQKALFRCSRCQHIYYWYVSTRRFPKGDQPDHVKLKRVPKSELEIAQVSAALTITSLSLITRSSVPGRCASTSSRSNTTPLF